MLMLYVNIHEMQIVAQRNVSPMTDTYREVHTLSEHPPPSANATSRTYPLQFLAPAPAQPALSLALAPNLKTTLLKRLHHPVRYDGQHRLTRDPVQRVREGKRQVDCQQRGSLVSFWVRRSRVVGCPQRWVGPDRRGRGGRMR